MSRWSRDPEGAADELLGRSLDVIGVQGRVLAAYQDGHLPALLAGKDVACTIWNRRAKKAGAAQAWAPVGPFDVALLRLPRAKDEQEMAAHACLSVLDKDGRLIVYGGNDEGIRSVGGLLEKACGEIETLATRGHGRVLACRRPADAAPIRGSLASWRSVTRLEFAGGVRDWVSYPGVFAAGRIDEGTDLLIGALPQLRSDTHVLDYGCGSGVIGAAAQAQEPGIAIDLMDNDAVALEAASENVPGARRFLGAALADSGTRYDVILSNPPLHQGFAETRTMLDELIAATPRHLQANGCLEVVVQRRIPLDRILAEYFSAVNVAAENGRFRVWRASNAPGA